MRNVMSFIDNNNEDEEITPRKRHFKKESQTKVLKIKSKSV